MRKLLCISVLTMWSMASMAAVMTCESSPGKVWSHGHENIHEGIVESVHGVCKIHKIAVDKEADDVEMYAEEVKFKITGLGPGLHAAAFEGMVLTCPTAFSKNLTRFPFYGVKASASFMVGVDVGVFSNKRGGVCILTGGKVESFGFGLSGAKLKFYN